MDIKEKVKGFPDSAGVYLMKDKVGRILYVGKASSLKKRAASYFHGIRKYKRNTTRKPPTDKTQALLERATDIDYIETSSSAQALLLENALIKRNRPYYNAALKDDKSYPYIKISAKDDYPCLLIVRGKKEKGARYYGPYTNVKLLKEAVKAVRTIFPFRSCLRLPKKPCLYLHLKLCPGMCVKKVNKQAYRQNLRQLGLFLEGRYKRLLKELKYMMYQAAKNQFYEEAALLRDRLNSLSEVIAQTRETKGSFDFVQDLILELQKTLRLSKAPERIEAFDISEIGGRGLAGSMVSFSVGRPDKNNYRKFRIKTVRGIDDYAMLREVLRRRFSHASFLRKQESIPASFLRKQESIPHLVLIDGGKGHLSCACAELRRLGLGEIAVIALAKRLETIYTSKGAVLNLPEDSRVLHLLQRIRDEAHRFAIFYHRKLRRKTMRLSALDEIPGVGPKRKRDLLRCFKSVQAIKEANLEDLLKVGSIDRKTAEGIVKHLEA